MVENFFSVQISKPVLKLDYNPTGNEIWILQKGERWRKFVLAMRVYWLNVVWNANAAIKCDKWLVESKWQAWKRWTIYFFFVQGQSSAFWFCMFYIICHKQFRMMDNVKLRWKSISNFPSEVTLIFPFRGSRWPEFDGSVICEGGLGGGNMSGWSKPGRILNDPPAKKEHMVD